MAEKNGEPPSTLPGVGGTSRVGARLIAVGKVQSGRVFTIGRKGAVIGRGMEAEISVDGHEISRRHARISPDSKGTWVIEDLGSRNGTFVNGMSVTKRALQFGDRVQLGDSALFIFTRYDAVEDKLLELQKMEVVGQLAGGVAHDFNNLFTVLRTNLAFIERHLVEEGSEGGELRSCFEETRTALERATEMTRRLLEISRRVEHEESLVDLSVLANEVVQICGRTFGEAIQIEAKIDPSLEVMGDRPQLHQVLMNLFINARDAMPAGGRLEIAAWRALLAEQMSSTLVLAPDNQVVVLTVSDDGEGMSEQVLARIFEPFFSTRKGEGGTGLGLATVYNVVKRHGGEIEVTSEPGEGTSFRVLLPVAGSSGSGAKTLHHRIRPAQHDPLSETGKVPSIGRDEERCVLLVDDDEDLLRSTGRLLQAWGYRVLSSGSGPEAVKLYEERRAEIGCVILDLAMPTLSGQETLRILRTINAEVRVILTSGEVDVEEVADLIPTVEGFVPKPHDADSLKSLLEKIFS